jgi:hypothetical protein
MNDLISTSLWIYGLAAVVSLVIAAVIKLIVVLLGRAERAPARPAPAPAAVAPVVAPGVPPQHVVVIAAAVYASFGEQRILHIEPGGHAAGWAAGGRHAHHTSHAVPTHPAKR